jgi:hypothetical protein
VVILRSIRVGGVAVLVLVAMLSACTVGQPQPATNISNGSVTLNGDVASNAGGSTEYWFR